VVTAKTRLDQRNVTGGTVDGYRRPMEIEGRNAVVTGGAVRVGRAICTALADAGVNVFIHYNRSAGPAEDLAGELADRDVTIAVGSADLSDPGTAGDLIRRASAELGPISILVNSASGFPEDSIDDVTIDAVRATHDLTLASPLFLTQAFAAALPEDAQGAVVNITDVKTLTPYRKHLSYMLAKGGVDTLTRAAAIGLAPRIRVNAVALGVILPPPGEDESYVDERARELPLQRVGGAEVVADTVVFLARNDFITGEIIRLDGGAHLT
jgi:NAD(P)-dependent dehydrogenase (short-subunit alcohol dehydrogenase family)